MKELIYIPTEYIVGNVLISFQKIGIDEVSITELFQIRDYLQEQSDRELTFILDGSKLVDLELNHSDYFFINKETDGIRMKEGKHIADLKARFVGYLPFNAVVFLVKNVNDYVNKNFDKNNFQKKLGSHHT